MSYSILATSQSPALIVYVLDVSGSMSDKMLGRKRVDIVSDALYAALQQSVFLSTKGGRISPRYRIAMFAYSDDVYDLLGGIKTIDQVAAMGAPELQTLRSTDTARAFSHVEQLLRSELPNLTNCPAPLVCHMTDGEFTGTDPEPIVRRIMTMGNSDGNVLVENIFISDRLLDENVQDAMTWPGVLPNTNLRNTYAQKLRSMSSPIPSSYRTVMLEKGYQIVEGAVMMLPGQSPELVEMGFVMSMSTPVSSRHLDR